MDFEFGDYCKIEQFRFGADNEMYKYKVIGTSKSNSYCDIPVVRTEENTFHDEIVEVVSCICCGVDETKVTKFKKDDIKNLSRTSQLTVSMDGVRMRIVRGFNGFVSSLHGGWERLDLFTRLTDEQKQSLNELRGAIGTLLCVYEPDNKSFTDLADKWDNLAVVIPAEDEDDE